ncbi:hypothetical protein FDJ44_gp51 [Microbacterium phage Pikmin]|uniref:Uncharacterized protein n=3 Tax=Pikminvirus pikmin TaxID=2560596 RepID=A0A2P1CKG5_9CAUD|nr:hypothetical protein FDJ44_gp51 [Microbacterium phage Pikmin]AVJ51042.1 hypothetical protein PBI_PAJAZA_51 [Microbacterium phage Pajaza]AVJ51189.1 hypothetical protein PBI_PIKMIN_51 [Microbacterium phage Pikmin]AVJ51747.1 hypothetical protein PBI_CASEY_51 [Microbacterium phage Casey]
MKTYCKHCQERIVFRDGRWVTLVAYADPFQSWGDPAGCLSAEGGHEPR